MTSEHASRSATVLFVCLHGSAKSLIAAEHLNRLAEARGLALRAASAGIAPDVDVPAPVVAGLAGDGIDVRGYVPRRLAVGELAAASHVVWCGREAGAYVPPGAHVERWDDLPMVSDGYVVARDAIVRRVEGLLASLDAEDQGGRDA